MSKQAEVMDDTAFFAEEAAQGAATSRLGVPRPGEGRRSSPAKGKVETTKTSGARAVEITECADSLITTIRTFRLLLSTKVLT